MAAAVRVLTPYVDFSADIANEDGAALRLMRGAASWEEFTSTWTSQPTGAPEPIAEACSAPTADGEGDAGEEHPDAATPTPEHRVLTASHVDRHEKKMFKLAMREYASAYPATCPRCIFRGFVEDGAACPCYVTKPQWQVRAFKRAEHVGFSVLWRSGWYKGGPKCGAGVVAIPSSGESEQKWPQEERA